MVTPMPMELSQSQSVEDLLRRGLDWLARLVPYDLGTVFLLEGDRLIARVARGPLATAQVRHHALDLDALPSLREALETRRARAFTEDDHRGEGDPFDGVVDLPPGHACMVVPLAAGERVFGVMTLDAKRCETYPSELVNLVEVYGQLLATALQNLEARSEMERLHAQDHAHAKLLEAALCGESAGVLETSSSASVRALAARARQVAETDTPVLLVGEIGTGKERLARALHRWSARAEAPFVTLHCAAVAAGHLEAELCGQVRSGTHKERIGRLQLAQGGTLFLDEVSALTPPAQERLLRVLQEKCFTPVDGERVQRVNVRLVAATTVSLKEAVARRAFREDLYHRLSVFPLELPPLRDRREDLAPLCEVLLTEAARRTGRKVPRVSSSGIARLLEHSWPGNLRELAAVLERALLRSRADVLGPELLEPPLSVQRASFSAPEPTLTSPGAVPTLADVQREHIRRVLTLTRGRVYGKDGAAALLGLKPSTLQSRMKKLGIERVEEGSTSSP